jgi:hypothetical protein
MTTDSEIVVLREDIAQFEFVWLPLLVQQWQPEYLYQLGQAVRPSRANGYLAVCTRYGLSGFREPIWPGVADAALAGELAGVQIGSCEWIMKRPESASIPAISSHNYTIEPSGLVVLSSSIVVDSRTTLLNLDGATALAGEYTITAEIIDSIGRDHVKRTSFILSD